MNITARLMKLDPTLALHDEGAWDKPVTNGPGFKSFNDAGIEAETGEFLYSMVRILKPRRALETGTHVGVGAAYMGLALLDNGNGDKLHTIEFLKPNFDEALGRFGRLGLHNIIESYLMDVKDFEPGTATYGLILLDTEPQTRFAELIKFYDYLEPGGFVFIHDLHRHMAQVQETHPDHPETPYWPWGSVPKEIKQMVKEDKLRPFHFSTPRGLTGFYKPHPEDYNFTK